MANLDKLFAAAAPAPRPKTEDSIRLKDPGNCRFSVLFWSDMHLSDTFADRCAVLRACRRDIDEAETRLDALSFGGDLTDFGKKSERALLRRILEDLPNVAHVLPVYGNHDIRFRRFASTVAGFDDLCKALEPGLSPGKLWYSFDNDACRFLVMGSDRTKFEESFMSDAQLNWLEENLAAADRLRLPSFVIQHQPLQHTHNLPYSWDTPVPDAGSVGAQSERLRKLLGRHENVFYVTGHLHRGFNVNTYEEVGRVHCVCLPSTGLINKDSLYGDPGLTVLLEVYADRAVFRPRDSVRGAFIPEYEKTYLFT
ncbi:MAG: metallophosphoesterase [Clostridia bacterium]|nr:metallophosphoesterase [Clostridia bacterium]